MAAPDRDQRLAEIVSVGRQTRQPVPRGLWLAALVMAVVGAVGFAVVMLATPAPAAQGPHLARVPNANTRGGLDIGLWIAAGGVIAVGFAIARQRASHSSRNSP